jgi:uncharacterized membrane protein YsdA (DUF1294 family)
MPWGALLIGFLALNAWTMHSFYDDKMRAMHGRRRIREDHLITLAILGGSIGAVLGSQTFRHKTRKQPFASLLFIIPVVQAAVATWFLYTPSAP